MVADETFDQLGHIFRKHSQETSIEILERFKFSSRKQGAGESLNDYLFYHQCASSGERL